MDKNFVVGLTGAAVIGIIALLVIKNGGSIAPQVIVKNQPITNSQVVVDQADTVDDSWLVIQTETNGVPGPVIGYKKLSKGQNINVSVPIEQTQATSNLFAMIHEDTGEKGKFDFPDNDMPLLYNDEMVSKVFTTK